MEYGGIAFVHYGEIPSVWHSRLLLAPTTGNNWIVLTADLDAYEEEMAMGNPDFTGFWYAGPLGAVPPHIPPGEVYGFRAMSPAALGNHMYQGKIAANSVRLAAGLPPLPPAGGGHGVVAPPPGVAAPPAPPAAVPGVLGGVAPPAPVPAGVAGAGAAEPIDTWVLIEESGGRSKGDILAVDPTPLPPGSSIQGERALVPDGPSFLFAKKVKASEVSSYKLDDLRILPVAFDLQGTRRRDFHSLFALLNDGTPQGGGLQLDGPPTVLSLCKMMRDQSMTPTTFHEYWLRTSDIPKGDRSVYEHECLSRILESMLTVDQINAPALQSAELLCRRMQVIREAHRISPGSPDYTSADVMMGWRYRRSGQGVVQELAAHVASELKNEAAIAKEARKAREEAENRRRNPKSKGKPSQEGGGGSQT